MPMLLMQTANQAPKKETQGSLGDSAPVESVPLNQDSNI